MRGETPWIDGARLEPQWPARLVMTDTPDDWSKLVEQIAELEELLVEVSDGVDAAAVAVADRIRALLEDKRRLLHAIDVG
jgi:hypothetical protein